MLMVVQAPPLQVRYSLRRPPLSRVEVDTRMMRRASCGATLSHWQLVIAIELTLVLCRFYTSSTFISFLYRPSTYLIGLFFLCFFAVSEGEMVNTGVEYEERALEWSPKAGCGRFPTSSYPIP